jgi:prepilin signal peptidase PulO-like enzyme (type II secretory pathway)
VVDEPALEETAPPDDAAPYTPLPIREWLPRWQVGASLAVGAAVAGASFVRYGAGTHAVIGAIFCPALVLLSAIDYRHRVLPNIIVGPAAVAITLVVAIGAPHHLVSHLVAGAIGGGILLVLAVIRPSDMGLGDVKLVFLIGVALGSRTIAAMVYTSGAVIVLALCLIALKGRPGLKVYFPFGPLLALGALIAYFTG